MKAFAILALLPLALAGPNIHPAPGYGHPAPAYAPAPYHPAPVHHAPAFGHPAPAYGHPAPHRGYGLADSDHLDVGNLLKGNFDGFGNSVSRFLFIIVCADFLGNNLNGFSTDGTGDSVCVWDIFNDLDGESDIFTGNFNGWGADLSNFSHINNRAVLFGFLITVSMVGGRVSISRGGVDGSWVIRGRVSISWGRVNVGASQGKGKESQNCECLHVVLLVM